MPLCPNTRTYILHMHTQKLTQTSWQRHLKCTSPGFNICLETCMFWCCIASVVSDSPTSKVGTVTGNEDDHAYQGVQNCNELPTQNSFNQAFPVTGAKLGRPGLGKSLNSVRNCSVGAEQAWGCALCLMFYENGTFVCHLFVVNA